MLNQTSRRDVLKTGQTLTQIMLKTGLGRYFCLSIWTSHETIIWLNICIASYGFDVSDVLFPFRSLLKKYTANFIQWFPGKTVSLLYQASKDGFSLECFEAKCANKYPTLLVVRSRNGFVFGGFAGIAWKPALEGLSDPEAFLFTLHNPLSLPPRKYPQKPGKALNAVWLGSSICICDLSISNNANVGKFCCVSLGEFCADTTGKGKLQIAGEEFFGVNEIEVYLVHWLNFLDPTVPTFKPHEFVRCTHHFNDH